MDFYLQLLFYRFKEMRALCPTAFEEFKTGVDENMSYTPEVILFQSLHYEELLG